MLHFERWLSAPAELPPPKTSFVGLDDLGKGLALAALFQRTKHPLLAVFGSRAEARNAIDNFRYFAGNDVRSRVHYLPSIDFDFYRGLLPNPELLCERNVALYHALKDPQERLFVTTVSALMQKVVPPEAFSKAILSFKAQDEVLRDDLVAKLLEAGYQRQPVAYDPGVFSVRGGVIDIYCPLYPQPIRIEFFGDVIEEIRFFDPQSQRSLEALENAVVIPVGQSLIPHGEDYEKAAIRIKERLDALGIPKVNREVILEQLKGGLLDTENALLFPLLSGGSAPIPDFFPASTIMVWDGREKSLTCVNEKELPQITKHVELFEKAPTPIARQEELFVSNNHFENWLERNPNFYFETFTSRESESLWAVLSETVSLEAERDQSKGKSSAHLEAFARRFRAWMDEGYRVQIVCHTRTHADRIQMLFDTYGIKSSHYSDGIPAFPKILTTEFSALNLWQGFITQSQIFPHLHLVVLSEEEIFGRKKRVSKSSSSSSPSRLLSAFKELNIGDFVVHKDHGIGRYLGLKSMNFLGVPNDYVLLEYKDGDKLYVPVYRLNVLQKYSGGEGATVVVDKMGGDRWSKARLKAERAVAEIAAEFLKIQARRRLIPAFAFSPPGPDFREFEMKFPFDETPDQMKAIDDVMADLSRPHPMDRLICGDVGYGKTEVALRAAFRAVLDNKQVAVVVPTTVLAFQHFETFKNRMKDTGARVEMISRLRSSSETKRILQELREGKIDVVVGTHRLFSSDVVFKSLGIIIVDEEHRFGVAHKEKLKKLAASVHVLSMTATPIPRTLNMAMTGIKDISIITTPPPDRLSVRTFVARRSEEVIREAISNELTRDGQIFFVHNRIEGIFGVADELKKMFPRLKFDVVHGQMEGDVLEKKMLAFYRNEFQLLLTTAIIESGLDIPRANTIIIDQADLFGLAQLYQLRGRVGRSDRRAYCYCLVPPENQMTADAKQRLQVIQRYTDLGAGFNVASHDLEIRGAGDLLGKDQSGHLSAVGVDLYFELLEESIRDIQGLGKKSSVEPEINLKIAAFFPQDYLPDITERINLYRRLSSVESEEEISEIEVEIRDRFGVLPEEVTNLIGLMRINLVLKRLHVLRMSCGPKRTSLQFAPTTPASPGLMVKLVQSDPKRYSVTPDQKLVFNAEDHDWKVLLREVEKISDLLVP